MRSHPFFDLCLHDDKELAGLIGEPLAERVTLHQWPLSCVERITGRSGRKWIYKTQSGPTVEHRFYAQARSPLLPEARTIYDADGYVCLLIECVNALHFDPTGLTEDEVVQVGRTLVDSIAEIEGDLPAYKVVDSAQWSETSDGMLCKLSALVEDGTFVVVRPDDIANILRACTSKSLHVCLEQNIGLVHGDLTADNVLVKPGTSSVAKLIDWQYVLRGPRQIDLAIFLDSLGMDPSPHVGLPTVRLMMLMRIHWLLECATIWFVNGASTYDSEIADMCKRLDALS